MDAVWRRVRRILAHVESAGGDPNHFACCKRGLKKNQKKESGAQRHRFEGQGRYTGSLERFAYSIRSKSAPSDEPKPRYGQG